MIWVLGYTADCLPSDKVKNRLLAGQVLVAGVLRVALSGQRFLEIDE